MQLVRSVRILAAVGLLAASIGQISAVGHAMAADSREKVRLTLLDNCVMDEWKKRQVKDKIADECKCASAKAAKEMTAQEVSAFKGKLDRGSLVVWASATKTCFKSATAGAKP